MELCPPHVLNPFHLFFHQSKFEAPKLVIHHTGHHNINLIKVLFSLLSLIFSESPLCVLKCLVASVVSDSFGPHGVLPTRLLCPWDSPARILEWVAMPSSRGSSQPRDQTHISYVSCMGRQLLYPTLQIFSMNPGPNLPSIYITNDSKDPTLCLSVQFSCIWLFSTHGLRHARPCCPSPTPWVYSNSCPSSRWCHPTISSSVIPFSSHLQSLPASRSFQMSPFFISGGQNIGVSASTWVLPMNTQDWFPLGWTSWISLDSQESSPTPQFKIINPSVLSFHALEKEMATHSSVLAWRIPGMGSLVGCHLWGHTESDTTAET